MGTNRTVIFLGLVLVVGGVIILLGNLSQHQRLGVMLAGGVDRVGGVVRYAPDRLAFPAAFPRSTSWVISAAVDPGRWSTKNFSQFVGDIRLDLTQAVIQPGETRLRFSGFVGDVVLSVPAGVGVSLAASAFVSDLDLIGQRRSAIFTPVDYCDTGVCHG